MQTLRWTMKIVILVLASLSAALCQSLTLPGPGMPASSGGSSGPCTPASGYSHCRGLTIDHTQVGGSALSGFPVLVSTTLGSSRIQNSNCYDIVFTSDPGGTAKIPWEQETCVQSTGALVDWVRVPSISSIVDTVIYVSYDNASISTAQNTGGLAPANVWDSGYKGVWHFGNGTTLNTNDSSSNANNGTVLGTWTPGVGEVDGAAQYVGGNGISATLGSNVTVPLTVELWSNGGTNADFLQAVTYSGNFLLYGNGSRASFFVPGGELNGSSGELDGNWHHIVATVDGTGNGVLYFDGSSAGTGSGLFPQTSTSITFGVGGFTSLVSGKALDEVRISNIVRSAGWIAAEYNNQKKASSTFLTIGSEL